MYVHTWPIGEAEQGRVPFRLGDKARSGLSRALAAAVYSRTAQTHETLDGRRVVPAVCRRNDTPRRPSRSECHPPLSAISELSH